MNNIIAPLIFGKGPDAIEILRQKAPNPFWKVQVSKEMARAFMFATTKVEIASLANPKNNLQYLIQECLNENLEWRNDVNPDHPFKAVFDFIQNRIKYADKSTLFNFIEKFDDLRKPPYGLSANFASIAMVTFALRGWANKIFDTVGKPIDQNSLVDAVGELFNVWDKGKTSNKLSFKFQTPEEGKLCKTLVKTLKLDKLKGYNDVSSLTDARFTITRVLLEEKGYPMWSLKYMDANFVSSHPAITLNDELRKLFANIVDICNERDKKNPALVKETLELLEKYRADIPDILAKPRSFANGFNNFLLSQQDIELKTFEIESAYDYIKKHLESTIGYWTEEEVAKALMSWRIALNKEIEEQRRIEEEEERKRQEDERRKLEAEERIRLEQEAKEAKDKAKQELKGKPEIVAKKKVSAREFIDKINSPEELRSILGKVIDLGYEFVIDEILNSAPLNK